MSENTELNWLVNPDTGFYNFERYVDESYLDLVSTDPNKMISYPIPYLNDALGGIMKSEFVVIGADSGCGKTELANSIAFHNARQGKEVYLFSLEGDRYEVMNRQRYKLYMQMVNETARYDMKITYREFMQNKFDDKFRKKFHAELIVIDELFKSKYKSLHVYNREEFLTMDLFEGHLDLIKNKAEVIIIDHLHYFDFRTSNEYSEINEIMKRIKRLQDTYRLPIILISHLRKKEKTRIFPDQNDFHGSSNIVKQADTCIAIAHPDIVSEESNKDYEEQVKTGVFRTGIRVVKARTGFSSRLLALVDYDLSKRRYDKGYKLAICGNQFITDMDEENYPKWAKEGKNAEGKS